MYEFMVASFRSRSDVMAFDKALIKGGVKTEIMPTPKKIAIGCGISVKFANESYPAVKNILSSLRFGSFDGIYLVSSERGRISVLKRV